MLIGIEAERANHPHKTGVEHYAKQLILHLAEIDKDNDYILYLRTSPEDWFLRLPKNFRIKILGYGGIPFPFLWTQLRLSWEMLTRAPDVLFVPAASLPLVHPKKSYITVHDVAWKFYPETFKILKRWYLEFTARFACRFARGIIAVSQSTKNDLVRFYRADSKKITVVHHGYEKDMEGQAPGMPDDAGGRLAGQGPALQKPFVLFLSTLQPRKNLEGLVKAFGLLKRECPELPHKLVVVGKPGWKFVGILRVLEENKDDVEYLNHVSDADRLAIIAGADLLVLPSFYEGFGMQILEAFAAHVPVATSNVSSMPEVAGEAAVYFDPKNIVEIKNVVKSVLLDKSLADTLRQKGKDRLRLFSWEKCAKETLAVLMSK